ncbi:hypothetical protein HDV05_005372 [Chytridiales sp. JEL 0842]|nr:hypothetical protein HDV05_005372 [Chytridiales sp. JEL 0842]
MTPPSSHPKLSTCLYLLSLYLFTTLTSFSTVNALAITTQLPSNLTDTQPPRPTITPSLRLSNLTTSPLLPVFQSRPFITRKGSRLYEGPGTPFRFISFNIPNLHFLEDRWDGYTLPTPFEQTDALTSISMMGGRLARTYTLAIVPLNDPWALGHIARFPSSSTPRPRGTWTLIPGTKDVYANEDVFKAFDSALVIARRLNVRICFPFIDRWPWWGGIERFSQLFGKSGYDFYTDPTIKNAFLGVVSYVVNRVNSINGVPYKNDPTIAIWETGNELITMDYKRVPAQWTIDVARRIKSLDKNHLIMDGAYGLYGFEERCLSEPTIDLFTNHYYQNDPPYDPSVIPRPNYNEWTYAGRLTNEANFIRSRGKAFIVGEVGLAGMDWMSAVVNRAVENGGVAGLLVWSLRFHARDGGFYTHFEAANYYAYHYPGFSSSASGFPPDELAMLMLLKSACRRVASQSVQGLWGGSSRETLLGLQYLKRVPSPAPEILAGSSSLSGGLRWRGSAGAEYYVVEKSTTSSSGPWVVVGARVSDAVPYGQVLFRDSGGRPSGAAGVWFRVQAVGEWGRSSWGNVVNMLLKSKKRRNLIVDAESEDDDDFEVVLNRSPFDGDGIESADESSNKRRRTARDASAKEVSQFKLSRRRYPWEECLIDDSDESDLLYDAEKFNDDNVDALAYSHAAANVNATDKDADADAEDIQEDSTN